MVTLVIIWESVISLKNILGIDQVDQNYEFDDTIVGVLVLGCSHKECLISLEIPFSTAEHRSDKVGKVNSHDDQGGYIKNCKFHYSQDRSCYARVWSYW